jgi:cobalt/nickel transport system permease protein
MSLAPEPLPACDSVLARRDPRWRLAGFALAMIGVALVQQLPPAVVALGFALGLAVAARVPWAWYRARMGLLLVALLPFLIVVPFVVDRGERLWDWRFLHVTDAGLVVGAVLACKTVALVTLALTLLVTAPLHVTLSAAAKLGVPRLLVQLTQMTYRYVFLILDELNRLRTALRVRGFRNAMTGHAYRTVGQVAGTLIVRGADRADRVAHAMRCRGFDGRFRTLDASRTRPADVLMFGLMVGTVGGLVAWDVWG